MFSLFKRRQRNPIISDHLSKISKAVPHFLDTLIKEIELVDKLIENEGTQLYPKSNLGKLLICASNTHLKLKISKPTPNTKPLVQYLSHKPTNSFEKSVTHTVEKINQCHQDKDKDLYIAYLTELKNIYVYLNLRLSEM